MSETPETDAAAEFHDLDTAPADFARNLERQRNEAREAFVIATDQLVQVQGELRQASEENARLRETVKKARDCILRLIDNGHDDRCDWINLANASCTCGLDAAQAVLEAIKQNTEETE